MTDPRIIGDLAERVLFCLDSLATDLRPRGVTEEDVIRGVAVAMASLVDGREVFMEQYNSACLIMDRDDESAGKERLQ